MITSSSYTTTLKKNSLFSIGITSILALIRFTCATRPTTKEGILPILATYLAHKVSNNFCVSETKVQHDRQHVVCLNLVTSHRKCQKY